MQTAIHVQDFHGDRIVEDKEHLLQVLDRRSSQDANLFTLSSASLEYPWLNVYVRNGLAVLYYLPSEDEMYASAGGPEDYEELEEFYDSETSVNWLPVGQVVSWSSALVCIERFCDDFGQSNVIGWSRLS
jgi:hypothetical protein